MTSKTDFWSHGVNPFEIANVGALHHTARLPKGRFALFSSKVPCAVVEVDFETDFWSHGVNPFETASVGALHHTARLLKSRFAEKFTLLSSKVVSCAVVEANLEFAKLRLVEDLQEGLQEPRRLGILMEAVPTGEVPVVERTDATHMEILFLSRVYHRQCLQLLARHKEEEELPEGVSLGAVMESDSVEEGTVTDSVITFLTPVNPWYHGRRVSKTGAFAKGR
uniref:Uncharacterized protein n=1 Tax=Steinernema glaseri TaxID=37863 RepID=A0A1I8A4Z8_9BILA